MNGEIETVEGNGEDLLQGRNYDNGRISMARDR